MVRRLALPLVGALLLGAGLVFAWWGLRAVALERRHARTQARERAEVRLDDAVAHVLEEAKTPTSEPEEHWTVLLGPAMPGPPLPQSPEALLVREADHVGRVKGDLEKAYEMLVRIANDERAGPWRAMAAWRAAAIRLRQGRTAEVKRLLTLAVDGARAIQDDVGLPVKTLARYHLAVLGVLTDDLEPTGAFLDLALGGRWLSPPDQTGVDDLLLALGEHVRRAREEAFARQGYPGSGGSRDVLQRKHAVAARLVEALDRVQRGHRLLAVLPEDGVVTDEMAVARREGQRIEVRPAHALLAGLATSDVAGVQIVFSGAAKDAATLSASLPAPLEAFDLSVRPLDPPSGTGAVVGLVLGLGVYLLGSGLALAAIGRSQRVAAMQSDFVAAVSHELKTPIASVRAMAEFLADGTGDDEEKVRDYARRIEGEMGRLGATVRNVLDVARIERQGRLPVVLRDEDPAEVVRLTCEAFQPTLEARGFSFLLDVRPAPHLVALDRGALQSVLMNLIDNAAKFSGDERVIEVDAGPEGEVYRIAVLDRGRGLPTAEGDRLFRRFVRDEAVKRDAVPGVGLGLYVAREIVEAHGGTVQASPREGGGSVFEVKIPLVATKAVRS